MSIRLNGKMKRGEFLMRSRWLIMLIVVAVKFVIRGVFRFVIVCVFHARIVAFLLRHNNLMNTVRRSLQEHLHMSICTYTHTRTECVRWCVLFAHAKLWL